MANNDMHHRWVRYAGAWMLFLVSVATLVFVFFAFQSHERGSSMRVFAAGSTVPILVSVIGAGDVARDVQVEYGIVDAVQTSIVSDRRAHTLKGAEVFTQDILIPENIPAGAYTAYVTIIDETGASLEAGNLIFAVHSPGFSPERVKTILLYVLFCVAVASTLYIARVLWRKHKTTF